MIRLIGSLFFGIVLAIFAYTIQEKAPPYDLSDAYSITERSGEIRVDTSMMSPYWLGSSLIRAGTKVTVLNCSEVTYERLQEPRRAQPYCTIKVKNSLGVVRMSDLIIEGVPMQPSPTPAVEPAREFPILKQLA